MPFIRLTAMATATITWSDSSVSTVDYGGEGSQSVTIGHSANEGLDRTASLEVSASPTLAQTVTLLQYGLREMLVTADGFALAASDGIIAVPKGGNPDRPGESSTTTHALGYDGA